MADIDSRTGTTYGTKPILDWVADLHAPHDDVLQRAFDAPARTGLPAIQLGPSEGRLLSLLVRLAGVVRAVEVGTLAGYSGLCIARALPEHGKLFTIDHDPNACRVAREHFALAGLVDRVDVIEGDGPEALSRIEQEGPFDMVFVDADKARYDVYGRWARANLRPGGLLIGDNSFFFGRLLDPADEAAAAMRRFHQEMAEFFDSVCVPTPDGLAVGMRR